MCKQYYANTHTHTKTICHVDADIIIIISILMIVVVVIIKLRLLHIYYCDIFMLEFVADICLAIKSGLRDYLSTSLSLSLSSSLPCV